MGIGGGAILIPALVFFTGLQQQSVQGANLVYFIPTAVVALTVHIKEKQVEFKAGIPIVFSGILGAVAGALAAVSINAGILKKMFGVFLLVVGINEILRKKQ